MENNTFENNMRFFFGPIFGYFLAGFCLAVFFRLFWQFFNVFRAFFWSDFFGCFFLLVFGEAGGRLFVLWRGGGARCGSPPANMMSKPSEREVY